MNCHRARLALVERELGLLTLGFERGLERHLESCDACRGAAAREAALIGGLTELRELDPPPVEVRHRVMERVRELPAIERGGVGQEQLTWASAAAVAAAVGLVAWIWLQAGAIRDAAEHAADGTRVLVSAAYSTLVAIKSLLVLPWKVMTALAEATAPVWESVVRLEPAIIVAITLGLVSMAVTIAWVVGNDLRRPLPVRWRKDK